LPNQTFDQLQSDVQIALSYQPTHVSYYHLTLEPNTYFHRYPPILPDDEIAIDMQEYIESALSEAGLCHYEVSAYARAGHESIHNTNYWQFGDYIGIGAGAHGKISMHNRIVRQARYKSPHMYLSKIASGSAIEIEHDLTTDELPFEFMLNALRLRNGAKLSEFMAATGLTVVDLEPALSEARAKGLMDASPEVLRTTDLGWRFLSDVQTMFLK
jgi:oxygen-independent coproporphyrinogen-3 oxidase